MEVTSGSAASSSCLAVLTCFPRFRLSVVLTSLAVLVADLVPVPLTGALVVPLVGFVAALVGVDFPTFELLVKRVAAASASEVLLGLDDDAVDSTTFFCLFVGVVFAASAAGFALRLAGAMVFLLAKAEGKMYDWVTQNQIHEFKLARAWR